VRRGLGEVDRSERTRRGGCAGRARAAAILEVDPTLPEDLEALIDPGARGDRESPLRWTSKSVAKPTDGLATPLLRGERRCRQLRETVSPVSGCYG